MRAPSKPVLKNSWSPSGTPKNAHLTTNHESGQIASVVLGEKHLATPLCPSSLSALSVRHVSYSKESHLNPLQSTDNSHEKEEKNHSKPAWNTIPHGSLAIEESHKRNCEG